MTSFFGGGSSSQNNNDDEQDPLEITNESDRRALLALACEHDRVDILQSLLTIPEHEDCEEDGGDGDDKSAKAGTTTTAIGAPKLDLSLLHSPPTPPIPSTRKKVKGSSPKDNDVFVVKSEPKEEDEEEENDDDSLSSDEEYLSDDDDDDEEEEDNEQTTTASYDRTPSSSISSIKRTPSGEAQDQTPNYFIPPLHIAVASGSIAATTALLRMGADPSVTPSGDIPLGGPMTKYRCARDKGAYLMLTTHAPTTMKNNTSMKERMEHAFAAEALRALGADEDWRLKQLIAGGMPVKGSIMGLGGRSLYEWAVDMEAVKCCGLLQPDDDDDEGGEKRVVDGEGVDVEADKENAKNGQQAQDPSNNASDAVSVGLSKKNTPKKKENGTATTANSSSPASFKRHNSTPMEHLRTQLEEHANLESSLRSCLDNLAEEISLYQAILFNNLDTSGGASHAVKVANSNMNGGGGSLLSSSSPSERRMGLVNKVRMLKAAKAQQEMEFEFYQNSWMEAEEELEILMEDMGYEVFPQEKMDQQAATSADAESLQESVKIDSTTVKRDLAQSQEEDDGEDKLQMERLLAASQANVRHLRASIADLAEENARNLTEVERLGLSGAVKMARSLREELREIEYAVTRAKKAEADYKAKIEFFIEEEAKEFPDENDRDGPNQRAVVVLEEEEEDDGVDVDLLSMNGVAPAVVAQRVVDTNETDHTSTAVATVPTSTTTEGQQEGAHVVSEGSDNEDEYYEDDEEEDGSSYYTSEEEKDDDDDGKQSTRELPMSVAIATGKSTSIAVRTTPRYVPIDIWELLWRIMGLGKKAAKTAADKSLKEATQRGKYASQKVMIV